MDNKWRQWAKLDKEPEACDPLPGHAWVPATIDVYGTKLEVLQMQKMETSNGQAR